MKRVINYLVIALVVLLPLCVSAKANVSIVDLKETYRSDGVGVQGSVGYEGLTLNVNPKFKKVEDSIIYELTIQNKDNEDYAIADYENDPNKGSTAFPSIDYSKSKYINYNLYCDTGYVLKANSKKTCTLSITYIEEPSDPANFSESNQIVIHLNNDPKNPGFATAGKGSKVTASNPQTTSTYLIIGLIILTLLIATLVFAKGKTRSKLIASALVVTLMPVYIFALTRIEITINSKVTLDPTDQFCYFKESGGFEMQNYTAGMTWNEFLASSYNTGDKFAITTQTSGTTSYGPDTIHISGYAKGDFTKTYEGSYGSTTIEFLNSTNEKIMSARQACYAFEPVGSYVPGDK